MTAFERGYDAFLRGQAHEQNPFDKDKCPYSCERWLKGWMKARADR